MDRALLSPAMTRGLWMGTFHSIFARILRDESDRLGYPRSYTIYDSSDAKNMVKTAIRELNLSDETYKPGDIAARISLAKNNLDHAFRLRGERLPCRPKTASGGGPSFWTSTSSMLANAAKTGRWTSTTCC